MQFTVIILDVLFVCCCCFFVFFLVVLGFTACVFLFVVFVCCRYWKHLRILYSTLVYRTTNDCGWIWCIWRTISQMHLFISNVSWKFETDTVITFLLLQTDHGMGIPWLAHQTPSFPWYCLIQYPYLVLKHVQSLNPWNKLKFQLQPNILFFQTHFRVSKLYIIWAGTFLDWDADTKVFRFKFC